MEIRYLLDENVDNAVADGLRRRGIDCLTAVEAGLRQAADDTYVLLAREQKRAIFTHDHDFLVLHQRGVPHEGIIYCPIQARSIGDQIRALVAIRFARTAAQIRNAVEFV
jgi:predicted nuclease of predicted toxin-antitoxin system